MNKHVFLFLMIMLSATVMFACAHKNDKPSESSSQEVTSSSFYDDDWYIDSQSVNDSSQDSGHSQSTQGESASYSSSGSSAVSYQEDDDADWTPFL